MQTINDLVLTFKHIALSGLLPIVTWFKNIPWLHFHWFAKAVIWEMSIKTELSRIESKLWRGL